MYYLHKYYNTNILISGLALTRYRRIKLHTVYPPTPYPIFKRHHVKRDIFGVWTRHEI
jgi:hypothetical protein